MPTPAQVARVLALPTFEERFALACDLLRDIPCPRCGATTETPVADMNADQVACAWCFRREDVISPEEDE